MQVSVASNLESFMNSDNKLDHDSYKEEINQSKKLEDVDQINTDSINNSAVYFRKHEKKEVPQDIENSLAEFKVALPAPGFFSKPVKGKRSFKPDKLEEKDAKRPKYIHVECQNSTTSVNENVKFSKK